MPTPSQTAIRCRTRRARPSTRAAGATLVAVLALTGVVGCSSSQSPTAAGSGSTAQAAKGGVQTVDAQEWITASRAPGATVVDVRTPAEFAAGHVEGAVNIDVESADFDQRIASLDRAATVAVYCRSGRRSQIAADRMAAAGFTSVVNLQGGVPDLQAAGAQMVAG